VAGAGSERSRLSSTMKHRAARLRIQFATLACATSLFCGNSCFSITSALSTPRDAFYALIAGSRDLGPTPPTQTVSLLLTLKDASRARLESDLAAIYDPRSLMYLHFKRAEQAQAEYGPDPIAVSNASAHLKRSGLAVDWTRGNGWMTVTGTAHAVEAEFAVQIHDYVTPADVRFWASRLPPTVPPEMTAVVSGSARLTSYVPVQKNAVPGGGLKPDDLARAYDLEPLRALGNVGSGARVVFLEVDGWAQSDLDTFTQRFGLPPMHPSEKAAQVLPPVSGEAEMDLEVVHALAPAAELVTYTISLDGVTTKTDYFSRWLRVQDQMIAENPGAVISISLGFCEDWAGQQVAEAFKTSFEKAAAMGETVFVSTGDSGGFECLAYAPPGTAPTADYVAGLMPAMTPSVTAVGGTRLSVREDMSWYNEYAWEAPVRTVGTGGNVSRYFQRPDWQRGNGVDNQFNPNRMRSVPDVSADADAASGAAVFLNGQWTQGGGTSQSAPIWAGVTVLVDDYLKSKGLKPVGFFNPLLYAIFDGKPPYPAFHDVVQGGNLVYPATPGYDLATGIGTPIAWNLARDIELYERQQ
jgi:kumamolisin